MEQILATSQSDFKLHTATAPLYDYGKLYHIEGYASFSPKSLAEAVSFIQYAAQKKIDLRFRGSGHTFNGVTLPKKNEVLVFTHQLDHYTFEADGSLTAGAGAIMWDVRDLARDYGWDLKVYNGGWAGPSVGGFINAGGFGKGNLSSFNGGLWESINSVSLIDAGGNLRKVYREDPLFPWLFGAYGQLGFVVEANFQLINSNPFAGKHSTPAYPSGLSGHVPRRQTDDPNENKLPPDDNTDVLFWYSMLVSQEQEDQAWQDLEQWVDNNPETIKPEGGWHGPKRNHAHIGYHYFIRHVNFHPPLIYPRQEDFLMIGVMSRLKVGRAGSIASIFDVERQFIDMAFKRKYRLYLQAENFGRNIDFRAYYGESIYHQFLQHKNELDPEHRINRHVFFDRDDCAAL